MAASREAVVRALKQVRPILSVDKSEARRRVFNLYRAWYRQIPYIGKPPDYVTVRKIFLTRRLLQ